MFVLSILYFMSERNSFAKQYHAFNQLSPVLIDGLWRSGTTLTLHLLNGHPELLVYPVEIGLPTWFLLHPGKMNSLHPFLSNCDADGLLSALLKIPSVRSLNEVATKGGARDADSSEFRSRFSSALSSYPSGWSIFDVTSAWVFASLITGSEFDETKHKAWVIQYADGGHWAQSFLERFPNSRVIFLVRDPRGSFVSNRIAEDSRKLSSLKKPIRLANYIAELKRVWSNRKQLERQFPDRFMSLRYEELVSISSTSLLEVSNFLSVKYDDVLLTPTIQGEPWLANSSFSERSTAINPSFASRWKSNIHWYEEKILCAALADIMFADSYLQRNDKSYLSKSLRLLCQSISAISMSKRITQIIEHLEQLCHEFPDQDAPQRKLLESVLLKTKKASS